MFVKRCDFMCILLFCCLLNLVELRSISDFAKDVVENCIARCTTQNQTVSGHFETFCGAECNPKECKEGCGVWKNALESSCQDVCNATSIENGISKKLQCVVGCNSAINIYIKTIKDTMGTPSAPALTADTLRSNSLSLVWEGPFYDNLLYLLQWKYENTELGDSWQYLNNATWVQNTIQVQNLSPYTKYRFRVCLMVSRNTDLICGHPSVVMQTSAHGKPGSGVQDLVARALTSRSASISWKSGVHTNGPLLSYALRLLDMHGNEALEEIKASNNNETQFYVFQNLQPNNTYLISVCMRNAEGEGPASKVNVTTRPAPMNNFKSEFSLIMGGLHSVFTAKSNDLYSDPEQTLYTTEYLIKGVGVDISANKLFIADSNGRIYKTNLLNQTKSSIIKQNDEPQVQVEQLSVDWLNKNLFMLDKLENVNDESGWGEETVFNKWQITRMDYNGNGLRAVCTGLTTEPTHFEVDPYNGYLFWALEGSKWGGLYRLDLAEISNDTKVMPCGERILKDPNLGAFTVDHAAFRILVAHQRKNTVLAVSLDGRSISDFRNRTQSPKFLSVRSLAYANGLFYWTDGSAMFIEEMHPKTNIYYHNQNPLKHDIRTILVNSDKSQVVPIAWGPPRDVTVEPLLEPKLLVKWFWPRPPPHAAKGAWHSDNYAIQIYSDNMNRTITNITDLWCEIDDLAADSIYTVIVAAVSSAGIGPWSNPFKTKTFAQNEETTQNILLWSSEKFLYRTDITSNNSSILLSQTQLKGAYIKDVSNYKDRLFMVTNDSTVMWYDLSSGDFGLMKTMDNVASLDVDWYGKRIYWSNPKQQLISVATLEGELITVLPLVMVAKQLSVDSLNGRLYWSSGHGVESALFNGTNLITYYPHQLYQGNRVTGLSLDCINGWVYWSVAGWRGTQLQRARLAHLLTNNIIKVESVPLEMPVALQTSSLTLYANRVGWLPSNKYALSASIDAANWINTDINESGSDSSMTFGSVFEFLPSAKLDSPAEALYFTAIQPAVQENADKIVAIPSPVNKSSININGSWNDFTVFWAPDEKVNVGQVYYDITMNCGDSGMFQGRTLRSFIEVQNKMSKAYAECIVLIKASTQWGVAKNKLIESVTMRTPAAIPERPERPRIFLTSEANTHTVTFRWDSPNITNGLIKKYKVLCWTNKITAIHTEGKLDERCCDDNIPAEKREIILSGIPDDHFITFQVRAYTDAGSGPYSDKASITTNTENPIPKIAVSSEDSLKIFDLDLQEMLTIPKGSGVPIDFSVAINENIIYWINNLDEILVSRITGTGHSKVTSLSGSASSITNDWISRTIYWSQLETNTQNPGGDNIFAVYCLDVTGERYTNVQTAKKMFANSMPIHNLQVLPQLRTLFWYEPSTNHPDLGTIKKYSIETETIQHLFNSTQKDMTKCNCPENPQVGPSFVLDDLEVVWFDPWVKSIVVSDLVGCYCRTVVKAEDGFRFGLAPTSIAVDSKNIYWINSTEKSVYYTDKRENSKIFKIETETSFKIQALDAMTQRYPRAECLAPKQVPLKLNLISKNSTSFEFELPNPQVEESCLELQLKIAKCYYKIYYKESNAVNDCDEIDSNVLATYEKKVVLKDLKAFTNYSVCFAVGNYYSTALGLPLLRSKGKLFRTFAHPPSPPSNVRALASSPKSALVLWNAVNGTSYEVHWRTEEPPHKLEQHTVVPGGSGSSRLIDLREGASLLVWVRAFSSDSRKIGVDSSKVLLHLPKVPNGPSNVINITARSLQLKWILPNYVYRSSVEYSEHSSDLWLECRAGNNSEWTATGLKPKTKYRFRLHLKYLPNQQDYFWPSDDKIVYETIGSAPDSPDPPTVKRVAANVLRVSWTQPQHYGDPITLYSLWAHARDPKVKKKTQNYSNLKLDNATLEFVNKNDLVVMYNGTELYWLVAETQLRGHYDLYVQAKNINGWSKFSKRYSWSGTVPSHADVLTTTPLTWLAFSLLAVFAVSTLVGVLYLYRKRRTPKCIHSDVQWRRSETNNISADAELAALRSAPQSLVNNALYDVTVHQLPQIARHDLNLTGFLGSGAFGEVFRGIVRNVGEEETTPVAVKTLRKGATEHEKVEFLQEARLMWSFKHPNILSLIGVCLDNDPVLIVMELMDGGDLLSYLRAHKTSPTLDIRSRVKLCLQVCRGALELSRRRFVHRDLAARNCLVRLEPRTVKIGDFGLARDVYKSDYYRKNGEGLLPVRWMAAECLRSGLFSVQSDVWAFAVLCWEVMSLGQQPYPLATNWQVLALVRSGANPGRPPQCPDLLANLLEKCWNYSPENRPTFAVCLEVLEDILSKDDLGGISTNANELTPQYLTLIDEEGSATPYLSRSTHSDTIDSIADGYEIPRHSLRLKNRSPVKLRRAHSMNATVIPHRCIKRRSVCDTLLENNDVECSLRNYANEHVTHFHKTSF